MTRGATMRSCGRSNETSSFGRSPSEPAGRLALRPATPGRTSHQTRPAVPPSRHPDESEPTKPARNAQVYARTASLGWAACSTGRRRPPRPPLSSPLWSSPCATSFWGPWRLSPWPSPPVRLRPSTAVTKDTATPRTPRATPGTGATATTIPATTNRAGTSFIPAASTPARATAAGSAWVLSRSRPTTPPTRSVRGSATAMATTPTTGGTTDRRSQLRHRGPGFAPAPSFSPSSRTRPDRIGEWAARLPRRNREHAD